jgi:5-oxoprolinase (ATP-hydrolysing)
LIGGTVIQAPQLDIQTVAAGGGSRLFFKNGMFKVGPESASSHPGPVCYRKNGYLTITDANLQLGRILPDFFPKIFGKTENEALDVDATHKAFKEITAEINDFLTKNHHKTMTEDEVAFGFIKVANATMARPIRSITVAKGYDTRDHILSTFGGAGPQHACEVASALGMKKVLISRFGGILSAYGIGLADIVQEEQEPCSMEYTPENLKFFLKRLEELKVRGNGVLSRHGLKEIETHYYLNMRYDATDFTIMVDSATNEYEKEFESRYFRQYGFTITGRKLIVDDLRVRCVGKTKNITKRKLTGGSSMDIKPIAYNSTYYEGGRVKSPVFALNDLAAGTKLHGPCIISQNISTIIITPNASVEITEEGDLDITLNETDSFNKMSTKLDPVQLSIFNHRFMSIAEQMGYSLQRTAISTNIKERLDFSCALFSDIGGLVANAPHLPVHLGSMSEAVRWQLNNTKDWKEGEVLVSNHPAAGGSHLPDITVITPVYKDGKPVFFVASRGHHADIGGISPGSMPPFSRKLSEEGAAIKSFKLVKNGEFQEEGIREVLKESRLISDNIADLKAQVSANQKGIALVSDLINEYSLEVVQAYMHHVQDNAEFAVKNMLKEIVELRGKEILEAEDYMDDGSLIKLEYC